MGYRETFFNNTPSIGGKYRCVSCGGWFTKSNIDVDHILPKRLGGSDELYNLQAMCKHCNRSKGKQLSNQDLVKSVAGAAITGNIGNLAKGVAKQKAKDFLGIKYKR